METVNIHDTRTSFSRLVDRALAGEEIIYQWEERMTDDGFRGARDGGGLSPK